MANELPPTLKDDIRSILSAPGVDLFTISAKRVRKELEARYSNFDVRANKQAIDAYTLTLFHEIKTARESTTANNAHSNQTRLKNTPVTPVYKTEEDHPPSFTHTITNTNNHVKTVVKPSKRKQSPTNTAIKKDEDLARALHAEINGGRRLNRTVSTTTSGRVKSPKKIKKSDELVESSGDEEGGDGHDSSATPLRKKKKTTKTKTSAGGGSTSTGASSTSGFNKEMHLSHNLSSLLGVQMCSRPQAVKRIWEYIKANNLQDPNDKRQIICDDALKNVFNVDTVHMFTMNKLLTAHLYNSADVIS